MKEMVEDYLKEAVDRAPIYLIGYGLGKYIFYPRFKMLMNQYYGNGVCKSGGGYEQALDDLLSSHPGLDDALLDPSLILDAVWQGIVAGSKGYNVPERNWIEDDLKNRD